MSEPTVEELTAVAESYAQRLGPVLFEPWARRVADAANLQPGQKVLDVACGTGLLARAALADVGAGGEVVGLDLNPGMLSVARHSSPDIDWRSGNAEALPFPDNHFDAVLSQFGLMLFADPAKALAEMYRVVKPQGHLVVAVFDALAQFQAYRQMVDIYSEVVAKPVGELLTAPFGLGEPGRLMAVCTDAGLHDTELHREQGRARFNSVRDFVLADVEGWFPFAGVHLEPEQVNAVVQAAERQLSGLVGGDGAVEFTVSVLVLTVTKRPSARDRKPLSL